jgi:hypothetical protein
LHDAKVVFFAKSQIKPQRQDSPFLDVEQQHVGMNVTPNNGVKDSVTYQNAKGDPKFQGKTLQDLLFVEMLAGTARLAKIARDQGIGILPVDKTSERASQIFVANYDVTNPEEFQDLVALLETEKDRVGCPPCANLLHSFKDQRKETLAIQEQRVHGAWTSSGKRQACGLR